jgi:hypothetical protein
MEPALIWRKQAEEAESNEEKTVSALSLSGERRARPLDAKPYDEIRIVTVPRYKQSSASGSEWRTSRKIQLLRKGNIIVDDLTRTKENDPLGGAMESWRLIELIDSVLSGNLLCLPDPLGEDNLCDQEGCKSEPTVTYKLKKMFLPVSRYDTPLEIDPYKGTDSRPLIRKFCAEHAKRGNQDFEDCDDNYEVLY